MAPWSRAMPPYPLVDRDPPFPIVRPGCAMRLPAIRGVIDRRILINYRVDPAILSSTLPPPFRPKLQNGYGLAGICLIRLSRVGPRLLPSRLGVSSENAAHRTAVEWDEGGRVHEGVFVRRRDTSSTVNSLLGGRLFPGIQHRARFVVSESSDHLEVAMRSVDGTASLAVVGEVGDRLPPESVFGSLEEASEFFRAGALGFSTTQDSERFQGMELCCRTWQVEPLQISELRSSWFDDRSVFPTGSIELDCALLMRNIEHEWLSRPDLCCSTGIS
ncbi:MAG: DUF2071 domain-containing protein [Isosphaeraceae bacterium]|nr:DUF2071 domain-containing protein [Isosphaeraceae bacterium]